MRKRWTTAARRWPGQVLAADAQHGIVVACRQGALRLTELQKPGGKRLPAAEFLKGFPLEPDNVLKTELANVASLLTGRLRVASPLVSAAGRPCVRAGSG